MKRPDIPRNQLKQDEARAVLDCLHDLAELFPHDEMAQVRSREALTSRLLARLLTLCAAQYGILSLASLPSIGIVPPRPAPSSAPSLSLLACQQTPQAEALAILQNVPLVHAGRPVVRETTCWMPVQIPLHHSLQEVWMLLGWNTADQGYREMLKRTWAMLPFVLDLAGTMLTPLLQREHSLPFGRALGLDTASQKLQQQIMEVLGTLDHEFRTPLATIKGYTDTLLRFLQQITPEEALEFLQAIRGAENRLETLITHVHEVAQLEAGVVQLDIGHVDLPSLVRRTIVSAQEWVPQLLRDNLTFHLHVRDGDGNPARNLPLITGDARRLRQIFEHLLENAIRFSPTGGRIDIVVQPAPQTSPPLLPPPGNHMQVPYLETCVCDYGIGIPSEQLERVFERFHRVDTGLTREVSGLGLGLTICSYLVALHQGRIWAESCPAGGSAFHLWLPLAQPILPL